MKHRQTMKLLKKSGWVICDIRGSHFQLNHKYHKGKVSVPFHSGDIPKGTLNSILKLAKLKGEIEDEKTDISSSS